MTIFLLIRFASKSMFVLSILFSISVACSVVAIAAPPAASVAVPHSRIVETVIATVDGEPITTSDLKRFLANKGESADLEVASGDAIIRSGLRDLILENLIEREAQVAGISVSESDLDAYVKEVIQQNRIDELGFENVLKQQGLTLQRYREDIKREILRARLISSRVRQRINIVDEDITRYLAEHPDQRPSGEKVHLQQIFLRSNSELVSEEELRQRSQEYRERIVDGEELSVVGKDDFLDLGAVIEEELRPELREAVSALENGGISEVITTDAGFYILRLVERVQDGEISGDLKERIRRELFDQQLADALDKYFNDELPAKYHVEIKL